jgi:hypothetical protein
MRDRKAVARSAGLTGSPDAERAGTGTRPALPIAVPPAPIREGCTGASDALASMSGLRRTSIAILSVRSPKYTTALPGQAAETTVWT